MQNFGVFERFVHIQMKIKRAGLESRGLFRGKQAEKLRNFSVWGDIFHFLG